ncbi:YEATS domain-containing protein 2 [Melipona quadrifasciata]|uniref:YEATS domain-containing protein 2 n=1 Tax=Melipona quadrifasciata TaxID=166423 RepID=A0A0M9ABT6_9HYME|nr:YEATS domain-containing protein 2 [Melipona quadrifasciata]
MSALKDQDPDYGPSDASDEKHQRIFEENARSSTARKITAIIEREFSQEINAKEKEVLEVQERLHRATKIIHLLRYVIVADFYNRKQCHNSQNGEPKQTQIHPAIKQLIGKSPKLTDSLVASGSNSDLTVSQSVSTSSSSIIGGTKQISKQDRLEKRNNEARDEDSRPKKIPRYIPPKSGIPESQCPSRGTRHKTRKRIIIGNISKWIPPEWREDAASHKWTMPNDVVEVTSAPFCLSRRGWGEFPLRVQLHFKSALNKPMDIIHHLKLDRTYTGLQTLGSETLVDIWIYADSRNFRRNAGKVASQNLNESDMINDCKVKLENYEDPNSLSDFTSNVSVNETSKLEQNQNCEVIVKKEPPEDMEIENVVNAKKQLFYIELDHDYCGSKYLNGSDGNLTIDHSSTGSSLRKMVTINNRQKEDTGELSETNEPLMNGYLTNIKVKEEPETTGVSLSIEVDLNASKVLPLSCSNIYSSLRPLEISIPPLFEPSGKKHVLVLQNNKTIPVDIAGTDYARSNDSTKSKANLATSRGVSLLKKPPGAEVKIQVRNFNGVKMQQGAKLQISKGVLLNSKKELYDQVFRAIEVTNIRNVQGLLRFIIRRMPIITWDAFDCDYRRLHPYACVSQEEYFSYSEAKRNACEWHRAKMIHDFLRRRSFTEEELWSTKEIMIWARLHGYTPLCSNFNVRSMKQQKSLPGSTIAKRISTCTQPNAVYKWLEIYSNQSNDNLFDILELEKRLMPFHDFVCETAREIGIKLISEEIVPTVAHCAAGRMIMRAVECLAEDLVRMSLAKAWERCSDNGYPKVIVLDDVRGALLNREEFDIFTNHGLASKHRLTAAD